MAPLARFHRSSLWLGEIFGLGTVCIATGRCGTTGNIVLAAIESGSLGPNSGRVVLMTDSTQFFDEDDGGFFAAEQHQHLFLNSIDYLATPEPSTLTLVGVAGAMGGLLAGLRRIRPRVMRR